MTYYIYQLDPLYNLYFQETRQTSAAIFLKKTNRVLHQKNPFPLKKQAADNILGAELWDTS